MPSMLDYGAYSPYGNPFGTGWYHGAVSKRHVSARQVLDRYPEMTSEQVELYLNGRDDGVSGDTSRLNPEG